MDETVKKEAEQKIKKEYEDGKKQMGRHETVMAPAVMKALCSFIEQDGEFAQAIVQNSQTFANCMASVAKGVGNAISDLDAYKRAVEFYFPGAVIEWQMILHVNPYEVSADDKDEQKTDYKTLSILDIL